MIVSTPPFPPLCSYPTQRIKNEYFKECMTLFSNHANIIGDFLWLDLQIKILVSEVGYPRDLTFWERVTT